MNIIIILLLIHILTYKKSNVLACGLFGWSGKNNRYFNRQAFTLLGLANQERGKDSCGVYDRKGTLYGVGINSLFKNYIQMVQPIASTKTGLVIGHTRKASVGVVGVDNAQPITLLNDDEHLKFVLTHNGTLENHKELAKKYNIDITNLETDSQVLAALISSTEVGLNILEEYIGAAALAFNWTNDDSVYLFRGESPMYKSYKLPVEERPLHIYQESPNSLYYSSEAGPLKLIAHSQDAVRKLKGNMLYKIKRGVLTEVMEFDRKNCYQSEKSTYYQGWNTAGYSYPYKDYYDDDIDDKPFYERGAIVLPKNTSDKVRTKYNYPSETIIKDNKQDLGLDIFSYYKGRFHINDELAEGKYIVNDYGLVVPKKKKTESKFTLYFILGVLMNNRDAYEEALAEREQNKSKYISPLSTVILKNTPYPVAHYHGGEPKLYTIDPVTHHNMFFSGKLDPVFTNRTYTIKDGLVSSYSDLGKRKILEYQNIKLLKYWPNEH